MALGCRTEYRSAETVGEPAVSADSSRAASFVPLVHRSPESEPLEIEPRAQRDLIPLPFGRRRCAGRVIRSVVQPLQAKGIRPGLEAQHWRKQPAAQPVTTVGAGIVVIGIVGAVVHPHPELAREVDPRLGPRTPPLDVAELNHVGELM